MQYLFLNYKVSKTAFLDYAPFVIKPLSWLKARVLIIMGNVKHYKHMHHGNKKAKGCSIKHFKKLKLITLIYFIRKWSILSAALEL